MAPAGRLALILTTGVTLGASLTLSVQESQKNMNKFDFPDLFELAEQKIRFAEEKLKSAWRGQETDKYEGTKLMRSDHVSQSLKGPGGYYVDEYTSGEDFPEWDLCNVDVQSNLDGKGPGSGREEVRFLKIYNAVGIGPVDLVVKALTPYIAHNNSANGIHDCFGIINLAGSETSTNKVDLEFGFYKTETEEPVTFSKMYFTIYDMDTGKDNTGIEAVTLYSDASKVYYEDDCKFSVDGKKKTGLTMTATSVGFGGDNPRFPHNLTKNQRQKSITAKYVNKATFKASFAVTGGVGGRNFMFAGESPEKEKDGVCRVSQDCVIWGDPHVITFDATQKLAMKYPDRREFLRIRNRKTEEVSVFEEGNFWLVKSEDVHIQGRYNLRTEHAKRTVLGGVAIGGPFLEGNTFIIRPLTGKITWNGVEVLMHLGTQFSNKLISAKYHKYAESISDGRSGDGIDITLPRGVKLVVNRFERGLAVKISMCPQKWQDGQCGNFNGNEDDDTQEFLMARVHPLKRKEMLPWREHRHLADSAQEQVSMPLSDTDATSLSGELVDVAVKVHALERKYKIEGDGDLGAGLLAALRPHANVAQVAANMQKGGLSLGKPLRSPSHSSDHPKQEHSPGCYVRLPSGCGKRKFQAADWTRDLSEAEFKSASTFEACHSRRMQFNKWCGVDDAAMMFVPKANHATRR